eukprot:TRINITY_DN6892_c0_g7_i1.p1 TRINITY_DN6892_c0_g7~~TRINITY_DN6892_c0_g7_i1.p1  ORF type:complete len:667 (+),score=209.63 TRINITY_DN6892_c0_g7_i1:232-2232(+)
MSSEETNRGAAGPRLVAKDRKSIRHSRFNANGASWSPSNVAKASASGTGAASYSSRYDSVKAQQPLPRWTKRCYRLQVEEKKKAAAAPGTLPRGKAALFRARSVRNPGPAASAATYPSIHFSPTLLASLDQEVYDFLAHMELTPAERTQRDALADRVRRVTSEFNADSRLEVFGSWHTDLCLPSSDIDFTLCGVDASAAYALQQKLKGEGFSTQLIPNSKVPLLRLTDPSSGVQADISFNMWRAADSAQNMRRLLQKYPLARPLIIALKSLLRLGNINELYSGGLSSYSLSLMVISYLQLHGSAPTPDDDDGDDAAPASSLEDNSSGSDGEVSASDGSASTASSPAAPAQRLPGVGSALVGFLEAYGLEAASIPLEDVTISVAQGRHIPRAESRCDNSVAHLSLEDPLLPTNDVAKGTFRIMDVRALFSTCLRVLQWFDGYTTAYEEQVSNPHGQFPMAPPPPTPMMSVFGCDPREWPGTSHAHAHPLSFRPAPQQHWGAPQGFHNAAPRGFPAKEGARAAAAPAARKQWATVREKDEKVVVVDTDTASASSSPARSSPPASPAEKTRRGSAGGSSAGESHTPPTTPRREAPVDAAPASPEPSTPAAAEPEAAAAATPETPPGDAVRPQQHKDLPCEAACAVPDSEVPPATVTTGRISPLQDPTAA